MSRTINVKAEILNVTGVPKTYIVARCFNGKLWYWGTWDDEEEALEVANQLGNAIVTSSEVA